MTVVTTADMALEARAEFYLCLAKAFSAHKYPLDVSLLQSALLPDLKLLAGQLPALGQDWLEAFDQTLGQVGKSAPSLPDRIMPEYARLFLMPPALAPLNLGYYLDGNGQGSTGKTLDRCYHRYGLALSSDFHDLPDHLALNLQWIAWVFASIVETEATAPGAEQSENSLRDLGWVLSHITLPACTQLLEKVQKAADDGGLSAVWPQLVTVTVDQLADDVEQLRALVNAELERAPAVSQWPETDAVATDVVARKPIAPSTAPASASASATRETLTCKACGTAFVADEALSTMFRQLTDVGLSTDHMEVCSDCQTNQPLAATMTPPGAKRFQPRH